MSNTACGEGSVILRVGVGAGTDLHGVDNGLGSNSSQRASDEPLLYS